MRLKHFDEVTETISSRMWKYFTVLYHYTVYYWIISLKASIMYIFIIMHEATVCWCLG